MNLQGGGYNIILNGRNGSEKLEEIKKDLESKFSIKCMILIGDISNEEDVKRMFLKVKKEFSTIDCLVNNAGIVEDMEIWQRSTEIFEKTMHNNVTGTYLMCKYFGKFMYDTNKLSRIINISSTNGINSYFPTSIDYDASKAAIISLTHNFALEYAPRILVNSVAPGWMNTDMNKDLPEDLIEEETSKIYLNRFAEPEEVARLVFYLGSDKNTYLNNEIIKIDGGY